MAWLAPDLLGLALVAIGLGACSDEDSAGSGGAGGGTDASNAEVASSSSTGEPATGFRGAVMPILQGCKGSMCHSSGAPSGFVTENVNADTLYTVLLEQVPLRAPDARYVVPGSPAESFLYAKLAGTQETFTCEGSCGDTMPATSDNIATIEAWIADGAPND